MRYRICPNCRNWNSEPSAFCLYCGTTLKRGAARIPREFAHAPHTRATAVLRAQRVLFVLALCCAVFAVFCPSLTRGYTSLSARLTTPSSNSATVESKSDIFAQSSGTYSIQLYLSQAISDDDATKSAADDIAGRQYGGVLTVSVDSSGTGSIQIEQAFFSPKAIDVVAFADESGNVSENTLYGAILQSGMKVSIVCVCEEDGISGFIWLDNDLAHIEFLYYGS